MSERVFLGFGSNIGDREANIFSAITALELRDSCKIIKTASIYDTDPLHGKDQPSFLNTVVEIQTDLMPEYLLTECQAIEQMLGRPKDHEKNKPRIIDIDILCYENIQVALPNLLVPHPEMSNRKFVLIPFAEIAPDFMVSKFRKTIKELLLVCQDHSEVRLHKLEKSA